MPDHLDSALLAPAQGWDTALAAQVQRATLPTGEEVAVKVQCPNSAAKVNGDLRVMRKGAAVGTYVGAVI